MKKHYQSAAQRLHEFAAEASDCTETEIRAELAAQGVNVEAFLARLGQEAGFEAEPLPTKELGGTERPRAFASQAGSNVKAPVGDWITREVSVTGAPEGQVATSNRHAPTGSSPMHFSLLHFAFGSIPLRFRILAGLTVILVGCFAAPVWSLIRFAWHSDLYSHILLVPFISAYLIWIKKGGLELASEPKRILAFIPLAVGLAVLAFYGFARRSGWRPVVEDQLTLLTLAFLSFLLAEAFLLVGAQTLRRVAFPLCFLVFIIPFPTVVRHGIEYFFQHGSAHAAHAFFCLGGMPVVRTGMDFALPGFSLEVAPECSGVHSSLVLFITSLLAGHLLLRTFTRRAILTLAVIPLALLRNGFRVFVIGELCVNISPDMINSPIHRHGGPLFFVMSLVPFFLLLYILRRTEETKNPAPPGHGAK